MTKPRSSSKQKISKEERLRRKQECEKRRREAIRSDPDKWEQEKENERKRYLKRKSEKKIKMIGDMTPREQRAKRKKWNENNKRSRVRKQNEKRLQEHLINQTPPESDEERIDATNEREEHNILPLAGSSRKSSGRRRVRKDRAKAYRMLTKERNKSEIYRKKAAKYRKKYERLLEKISKKEHEITPRKKVKEIIKGVKVTTEIKKRLLFGEVLQHQLTHNFKKLRNEKSKQVFTKAVAGKILKKYRQIKQANKFLSYKIFLSNTRKRNTTELIYEKGKKLYIEDLKKNVTEFLEQDVNSRLCPGKKDVIVRNKIKKQKRYLNGNLKELHKKFVESESKISYATFCRLKPFWLISPKATDRETCLCITHENFKMIVDKLYSLGIILQKNPREVLSVLCCNKSNEKCFSRKCPNCLYNNIPYQQFNYNDKTSYYQWVKKKENRISAKTGKPIIVQRMIKDKILSQVGDLIKKVEDFLPKYLTHEMNINHQYAVLTKKKENLINKEILIHIDFSENYSCKHASEPQSVHYGASRQQISLHTGVVYSKLEKKSFGTISESLQHDAKAVLAHLVPILSEFLKTYDKVDTLHFLSDGPSNQYRNKTMFTIIGKCMPKMFPNISTISWNYNEAGHGKGAPDGVGAVIKQTADRLIAVNKDVADFKSFVDISTAIKGVTVKTVTPEDIKRVENNIPADIPPIKGTFRVHQVTWNKLNRTLHFNSLSCFDCELGTTCEHYSIAAHDVTTDPELAHSALSTETNDHDYNVDDGPLTGKNVFTAQFCKLV